MIKCGQIVSDKREICCDNCKRKMPLVLTYDITPENKFLVDKTIWLCEDCSSALGRLHVKVMKQGKPHKYDMDEITEVE